MQLLTTIGRFIFASQLDPAGVPQGCPPCGDGLVLLHTMHTTGEHCKSVCQPLAVAMAIWIKENVMPSWYILIGCVTGYLWAISRQQRPPRQEPSPQPTKS